MMDKRYDAKAAEAKWYPIWEKNGYFHAEPSEGGTPYSVTWATRSTRRSRTSSCAGAG